MIISNYHPTRRKRFQSSSGLSALRIQSIFEGTQGVMKDVHVSCEGAVETESGCSSVSNQSRTTQMRYRCRNFHLPSTVWHRTRDGEFPAVSFHISEEFPTITTSLMIDHFLTVDQLQSGYDNGIVVFQHLKFPTTKMRSIVTSNRK